MSYTCLNYHIVFATKHRKPLISNSFERRLFRYFVGITDNMKSKLYIANGTCDHVHLMVSLSPEVSISDFSRTIKTNSSKWIRQTFDKDFSWQQGYSAFSVSYSGVDNVIKYIKGQQDHHKKSSFIDELKILLSKHKINYDPKYLE